MKEKNIYIPRDDELRLEIILLHHDIPILEHEGQWKTVELVTINYWWPKVTMEVK